MKRLILSLFLALACQLSFAAENDLITLPGTASVATMLTQETTNFRTAVVQISGTFVATITPEVSNDNVTYYGVAGYNPSNQGSAPLLTMASPQLVVFPLSGKYFRLRVSAYTSGTVTGAVALRNNIAPQLGVSAGQVGTWIVQPGNTANTTPWLTTLVGSATQGSTPFKLNSAASTNATVVKASAGNIATMNFANTTAGLKYVKLYNKATAPVVGTDVPVQVYMIGGSLPLDVDAGATGIKFTAGIAFAITTGAADTDTTAVAANDVIVNIGYY